MQNLYVFHMQQEPLVCRVHFLGILPEKSTYIQYNIRDMEMDVR